MPDIKNLRLSDYPYPQLREAPSGDCRAMPCSALFVKMESLAKGWEEEGKYLNNPWDDPSDRAAGRAYAECAETLRGLIKQNENSAGTAAQERPMK
jgi:hypothetical protein